MDWISIGKRIRRHREYLGFTREVFAEKLDITPKFCSDIENGAKGMSVPTLCRISNVLNLSVDYILFGRNSETIESPIIEMLKNCPPEKFGYVEDILKSFLLAVTDIGEKQEHF